MRKSGGGTGKSGGSGARVLKTRVKKKSGLKVSSRRWLERHMNDPYVHRSKAEGWRARSAFKLIEIDDRYHILAPGRRVIDLGAAPGGWCQVAVERTGSSEERPLVVGIDYLDMDPVPGAAILKMDFLEDDAPARLMQTLGGAPDVVLSDMAAPTTGHRRTDHLRTMHLCEVAADFAVSVLKPGGHFLAKTFQGGTEAGLLDLLKRDFRSVHHVKPPASREESVELYLLAKDFRGDVEVRMPADPAAIRRSEALICEAIEARRLIAFRYNDEKREVEPHILGYTREGSLLLSGWQVSGEEPGWRNFYVEALKEPAESGNAFSRPRPDYNRDDPTFDRVICQL